MGAGWHEREHRAFGFPFESMRDRFARLAEQVEIVHRSWGREPFDFDGRFYRLDGADPLPKPVQGPHPPLILGGQAGPRAAALAALWADEYNTTFASPDECRERRERIAAACRELGREPIPLSLMSGLEAGLDPDALVERLREYEAAGVERVMLQHLRHEDLAVVELIGREVIPAVR
jgi:alkanesulfonate monooxygenase SsuD/methylene tetrahydromethanopterin reductase-like flavin-dependent oxidoreductase (luciferase family)